MNAQAVNVFNWWALAPIIVVLGTGAVQVLLEAFVPRKARRVVQVVTSMTAIVVAFVIAIINHATGVFTQPSFIAGEDLVGDTPGVYATIILLLIGLLSLWVMADRTTQGDGAFAGQPSDRPGSSEEALTNRLNYQRSEFFPLLMFSLGGMMVFVQASSLLTMFVALEVMSLPLYILAASARRQRLISQEAGMKYFILGAFASAFFLMGTAFIFGATGSINLMRLPGNQVPQVVESVGFNPLMMWYIGGVLLMVGLLFKVAAAPFHAWTPDVYQGAPSPVTGFMAAGVKVAAFVALMRVLATTVVGFFPAMRVTVWSIAVLTIVVGTVMGLRQYDVKRMLAYSSIAHAGFLLIAVMTESGAVTSNWRGMLFYLLTYGVATVGAFGIITLVREQDAQGNVTGEATAMEKWAGLGSTHPLLAAAMTVFLLSFAGIPLTAGFMGKFWIFAAAAQQGATLLVVIAVLASVATAVFYFRLIRIMYFQTPQGRAVVVGSEGYTAMAVTVAALLTVLLGIFPTLVMNVFA